MAAPSKTLMEFLRQPAAKRTKRVSSPPPLSTLSDAASTSTSLSTAAANSSEQKARMEFNRALAFSRRNLKLCSDKVSRSTVAAGVGYVKLEELLVEGTWLEVLPGEFQKTYAKKLCEFVESETCNSSSPIYPPQHLIFNALNTTPFDRVKVVIIGQDPYHGPGQAMGLSFSVPEGIKVPSSLLNIYKELQQDLGCSIPSNGNLERWAVQGVLLLNAVLTVRRHQANSHAKKGWEQFTDAVIGAISQKGKGVVFLLWGNYAQAKSSIWSTRDHLCVTGFEFTAVILDMIVRSGELHLPSLRRLIDESKHYILKSAHPSGLSAHRGFFGCRHFSRTNQILEKMGLHPIDWQL